MKIVTGHRGTPHITSNDDQGLNQGIFGTGNAILDVGQKFEAALTDANTVSIADGEGVMQGVHFRILPGTVDDVAISNGTSGYNRIDLICARYTKDSISGFEDVNLVVIEGTPSESTPDMPEYNEGNILEGAAVVDFPLYKVTFTGITPALESLMPWVVGEIKTLRLASSVSVAANAEKFYRVLAESGRGLYLLDLNYYVDSPGEKFIQIAIHNNSGPAWVVFQNTYTGSFDGGHIRIPVYVRDGSYIGVFYENRSSNSQTVTLILNAQKAGT